MPVPVAAAQVQLYMPGPFCIAYPDSAIEKVGPLVGIELSGVQHLHRRTLRCAQALGIVVLKLPDKLQEFFGHGVKIKPTLAK
jgi:hypothetical protein